MTKNIEKQLVPVFHDDNGKAVAILLFRDRQRVIYKIEPADEDEILYLYQGSQPIQHENKEPVRN